MRPDFPIHFIITIALLFVIEKFFGLKKAIAITLFFQVGKEVFDWLDYGGVDVVDWIGDISGILVFVIIKKITMKKYIALFFLFAFAQTAFCQFGKTNPSALAPGSFGVVYQPGGNTTGLYIDSLATLAIVQQMIHDSLAALGGDGGNGIFGTPGTIPDNMIATLTASGDFKIAWDGGTGALQFNDATGSVSLSSKDAANTLILQDGFSALTGDSCALNMHEDGTFDDFGGTQKLGLQYAADYPLTKTNPRSLVDAGNVLEMIEEDSAAWQTFTLTLANRTTAVTQTESLDFFAVPDLWDNMEVKSVTFHTFSDVSVAGLDVDLQRYTSAGTSSPVSSGTIATSSKYVTVTTQSGIEPGYYYTLNVATLGTAVATGLTATVTVGMQD